MGGVLLKTHRFAERDRLSPLGQGVVFQKSTQRRLDGGITVNVCDRIHEACACDV